MRRICISSILATLIVAPLSAEAQIPVRQPTDDDHDAHAASPSLLAGARGALVREEDGDDELEALKKKAALEKRAALQKKAQDKKQAALQKKAQDKKRAALLKEGRARKKDAILAERKAAVAAELKRALGAKQQPSPAVRELLFAQEQQIRDLKRSLEKVLSSREEPEGRERAIEELRQQNEELHRHNEELEGALRGAHEELERRGGGEPGREELENHVHELERQIEEIEHLRLEEREEIERQRLEEREEIERQQLEEREEIERQQLEEREEIERQRAELEEELERQRAELEEELERQRDENAAMRRHIEELEQALREKDQPPRRPPDREGNVPSELRARVLRQVGARFAELERRVAALESGRGRASRGDRRAENQQGDRPTGRDGDRDARPRDDAPRPDEPSRPRNVDRPRDEQRPDRDARGATPAAPAIRRRVILPRRGIQRRVIRRPETLQQPARPAGGQPRVRRDDRDQPRRDPDLRSRDQDQPRQDRDLPRDPPRPVSDDNPRTVRQRTL